jgi:acyl dehydratase
MKIPAVPERLDYDWVAEDRAWQQLDFTVTKADVQRWARLHDDPNPWYDGPNPMGLPVAPSYIFYYPGQNAFAPRRDFSAVLASIGQDNYNPAFPLDHLSATTTVTDRNQRNGRAYVTWQQVIRRGAQPLARTRRTWAFDPGSAGTNLPPRVSEPALPPAPIVEQLPPARLALTIERLREFEGPGEHNGHTDPELNRSRGQPGALAQGALTFGAVCRTLQDRFKERWWRSGSVDIRLVKPVYDGDEITVAIAVRQQTDDRLRCEIAVTNRAGETTAVGAASVLP